MSQRARAAVLTPEAAVVRMVRIMGYNKNPIGAFREQLFKFNERVNFRELKELGYIKDYPTTGAGYFGTWIELTLKARNLYDKVNIRYRDE